MRCTTLWLSMPLLTVTIAVAAQANDDRDTVTVGIVVPDPDKVSNCLASLSAVPTMAQRGNCLREGLVANHAVQLDGLRLQGRSDAAGLLTLDVPQDIEIRFVFPGDERYAPTLGNETYSVAKAPLNGIPAHAMGKYRGATTPVIAKAAGMTADALTRQGLCIVDVLKVHAPPNIQNADNVTLSVSEPGYEIYAIGKFTPDGPADVARSNMSKAGRFGITKQSLTGSSVIHIQAHSNGLRFEPASCLLRPGFVTFAPYWAM